jgi:hypothetical protein
MTECLPDLPRYVRQRGDEWQGADHQNGPWRPIPAPQAGLPWLTDGPAVPTHFSPAAQAVEVAILKVASVPGFERRRIIAAAALRAAADRAEDLIGDTEHPKFTEGVLAAAHFLDLIAAELEGANG